MSEKVILVNEHDEEIGSMEKMEAHEKGVLHRAFSVFIFNDKNELLLQRRALNKYHSAGLWTNTCCSHPRVAENTLAAANRRLKEEMGMETELKLKSVFTYKTKFSNNLTEHEIDHVFVGNSNENPKINTEEVAGFEWRSLENIKKDLESNPQNFTSWFNIAVHKLF